MRPFRSPYSPGVIVSLVVVIESFGHFRPIVVNCCCICNRFICGEPSVLRSNDDCQEKPPSRFDLRFMIVSDQASLLSNPQKEAVGLVTFGI